jgi:hypothetical protein
VAGRRTQAARTSVSPRDQSRIPGIDRRWRRQCRADDDPRAQRREHLFERYVERRRRGRVPHPTGAVDGEPVPIQRGRRIARIEMADDTVQPRERGRVLNVGWRVAVD